jgi:hypothetical protein
VVEGGDEGPPALAIEEPAEPDVRAIQDGSRSSRAGANPGAPRSDRRPIGPCDVFGCAAFRGAIVAAGPGSVNSAATGPGRGAWRRNRPAPGLATTHLVPEWGTRFSSGQRWGIRLMEGSGNEASSGTTLRIGLAAARNAPSVEERIEAADRFLAEAAARGVAIVCFPEAYIPGLRGFDFPVPPPDQHRQERALEAIRASAAAHGWRRSSAWSGNRAWGGTTWRSSFRGPARSWGTRRRTRSRSRKSRTTWPTAAAGCSRSTGFRSGSPSATRGGATPRGYGGRRSAAPAWSSTRS